VAFRPKVSPCKGHPMRLQSTADGPLAIWAYSPTAVGSRRLRDFRRGTFFEGDDNRECSPRARRDLRTALLTNKTHAGDPREKKKKKKEKKVNLSSERLRGPAAYQWMPLENPESRIGESGGFDT